jgi:hypothetical protein
MLGREQASAISIAGDFRRLRSAIFGKERDIFAKSANFTIEIAGAYLLKPAPL